MWKYKYFEESEKLFAVIGYQFVWYWLSVGWCKEFVSGEESDKLFELLVISLIG